jgi:gamma-glutamyltranspeptidase/glutathione hydrolase
MRAVVSSAHPIATAVGVEILSQGGSAFDAAVAVSFALTVVESDQSSAITGDGFGLFRIAETGEIRAADWSSRTPLSPRFAERVTEIRDPLGPLSIQAPSALAGVLDVHRELGTMPLADLLAPAISYAENGFPVSVPLHAAIANRTDIFRRHPHTARNFLVDGEAAPVGATITFPELAATLRAIAAEGKEIFYKGRIAQQILAFVDEIGGVLTQADLDLAAKAPIWSQPVSTTYRGYRISAVPPVAGGIPLLLAMNILEGFDFSELSEVKRAHVLAETCKLMFIDMDDYFGDPDFVDLPIELLLSKEFATRRRAAIRFDQLLPWTAPGGLHDEDANTTHFNVIDDRGNIAAITQTRSEWGLKTPVGDTGIFLHNGLRLLSTDPGHPMFAGRPGMRLQKSMTPVIVLDANGQPVMALGAAGVRRITQAIVQVAVNHLDLGLNAQAAIDAPRLSYASRYEPLTMSAHYQPAVVQALAEMGHEIVTGTSARVQAITINPETRSLTGGADVFGAAAGLP